MNSENFLQNIAKQYVKTTGETLIAENAAIEFTATSSLDAKFKVARRRRFWNTHRSMITGVAASIVVLVSVGAFVLPYFFANNYGFTNESAATPALPPAADTAAGGMAVEDDTAMWDGSFYMREVEAEEELRLGAAQTVPAEPAPSFPAIDPELVPEMADQSDEIFGVRRQVAQVSLAMPEGWAIAYTDYDGDMVIFHLEGTAGNSVVVMAQLPPDQPDFSNFFSVLINDTWGYMQIESTHSVLIYEQDGVLFTLTTAYDYNDLIFLAESFL